MANYKYKPSTRKTSIPKYKPLSASLTDDEKALKAIDSQYKNLQARLLEGGIDPNTGKPADNRNFFEKMLNLDQDQGLLMDTFEVLDRPGQMIKGLITDGAKGAWEGLSGKSEISGSDFGHEIGLWGNPEHMSKVGKFAADLSTDIFTDPLTYIPGGVIAKGLFGSKSVGKLSKADEVAEFIETGLKAMNKTTATATADDILEIVAKSEGKYKVFKKTDMIDEGYKISAAKGDGVMHKGINPKAPGGAHEKQFVYSLSDELKKFGDDFVVSNSKTADHLDDVTVLKKMITKDGDELLMEVANIEVKDLTKGAFGSKFAMKINKAGKLEFVMEGSKGVTNFAKLGVKTQENLQKLLGSFVKISDDAKVPLQDLVKALKAEGFTKVTKTGKNAGMERVIRTLNLDPGDFGDLTELGIDGVKTITDILEDTVLKADNIGFMDDGVLKIVDSKDAIRKSDIGASIGDWVASGGSNKRNLNFVQTLKLKKGEAYNDITEKFLQDMMTGDFVQGKKGLLGLISEKALAETTPAFIKKPAQITKDIMNGLGHAFDVTKGFTSDFVRKLHRLGGESGQLLQRNSKKLAEVSGRLNQVSKNGLTMAKEVIESGATIVDGVVSTTARKMSLADLIDNVKIHAKTGDKTIVPILGNTDNGARLTAKNFEDNLNSLYKNATQKSDVFKVVEKNGSFGVELNSISYDEFKKLTIQSEVGARELSFGSKQLSDEAKEFFLQNADDIGELNQIQKSMSDILVKELGFGEIPNAIKGTNGYARHILSKEGKDFLNKTRPIVSSKYAREGVDMLAARTYLGSTEEVNKGLKAFYGLDVDVFDTNIQNSIDDLIRLTSTKQEQHNVLKALLDGQNEAGKPLFHVLDNKGFNKNQIGSDFKAIKSLDEEFGNIMKNLSPESKEVFEKSLADLGYTESKALVVHKSAHSMLKKLNNSFVEMHDFVKGYDKFMSQWKSVTLLSPGFHMRNLFGNMTNSYLVGMNMFDQAKYAKSAMLDFGKYDDVLRRVTNDGIESLSKADKSLYLRMSDFFESGVSQTNKGVRDLESVKKMLEEGNKGVINTVVKGNFDIAERMDDVQRYMLYQWGFDKGVKKYGGEFADDVMKLKARNHAAEITSEALFDYSHLTSFEMDWMKRLFPFYTFMKNNLVFQAKNIVKNPKYYARAGRAWEYAAEDLAGISMEDMPEYMKENMWLPIPISIKKDDKESITFLKSNLPIADFTELVENPFRKGATSITAPIKMLLELGAGTDFFSGSPIKEFKGQKDAMAEGEGFMPQFRDERGTFSLSKDPTMQKIFDDLGMRVPKNYLSTLFDAMDTATGQQGIGEGIGDLGSRLGLTKSIPTDQVELTRLYQQLEELRDLRSYYEQESGTKLPTKKELGIK